MISQANMTTTAIEFFNLPNFLHFKPHILERQTMATFSFPSKPLPLSCAFETTKTPQYGLPPPHPFTHENTCECGKTVPP